MDRNVVERYRLGLFGRMVMGVAHEVDNHLSVVLGFSELIQLAAGKEQKVRDGAGEKIGAIVQQFSHHVRPHAPSPEPFDPGKLIPEILQFSRYDLGRGNVTVLPPLEVPPGLLHADRREFGLALLALLFNAAEAMSEKGGELSMRVSIDGAGWEITVSDHGPGIPAGFEEKVFEVGFTTRTGPLHTGMGLPVARHLAGQAGGTVRLANGSGGGGAATIRMPMKARG